MINKIGAFVVLVSFMITVLLSCQESMADKAERQAKDYTRKYCPTPVRNCTRTDSIVFNKQKNLYIFYVSFFDKLDDDEVIEANKNDIIEMLQRSIKESTGLKSFIEAGVHFEYICHSGKNPSKVYLRMRQ